jgi:enoyl-CoA hydratase/carnithine racemase
VPHALDAASILALHAAIDAAGDGLIVLEGTDGVFCRGMDLEGLADGHVAAASAHAFARCLEALRLSPNPTIAVVDGPALGGGLGLTAACDVVLATERATFGLPELLIGLLPAIVLPVLLERVSSQRVRLLGMRGRSLTADEAHALGLVDELIPGEVPLRAVRRWTRTLCRPSPSALAMWKRYTAPNLGTGLERGALMTTERLADSHVLVAARKFAAGEIAPWLA